MPTEGTTNQSAITGSHNFINTTIGTITTALTMAQNNGTPSSNTTEEGEGGGVDDGDVAFFHEYPRPTTTTNVSTASTTITNRRNALPTKILFVHVGKTGGQSIKFALKAGCDSFAPKSPRRKKCFRNLLNTTIINNNNDDNNNNATTTALSDRVGGLIHVRKSTMKPKHADGFLVVMRHPIARSMSWYHFVNPNLCVDGMPKMNCAADKERQQLTNGTVARFFDCFPPAFHMTRAFAFASTTTSTTQQQQQHDSSSTPRYNISPECQTLAERVWMGKVGGKHNGMFGHMEHNLRKYASATKLKPPNVYLVRTDHLWEDMKSTDRLLGGKGNFGSVEGLKYTHYGERRVVATDDDDGGTTKPSHHRQHPPLLSVDVRRNMCCLLLDDMEWYRKVLAWAENLSTEEALSTWKDTVQECGESSWKMLQQKCLQLNLKRMA
jgi:hypothetical protein